MIEWFQEAFEAPGDRAQLIAILASAIIAITVLLLNQGLTKMRERKKLQAGKIEEMYLASIQYTNSANQIMKDLADPKLLNKHGYFDIDQAVYGAMNNAVRKMEILCGLYFPSVDFKPAEFSIGNMPIVDAAVKGKATTEMEGYKLYQVSRDHINNAEKNWQIFARISWPEKGFNITSRGRRPPPTGRRLASR